MSESGDNIRERVRQILLTDWDPSNASRFEASRGEYDGYISPLLDLIRSDADEDAVVQFLVDREREIMCFPGLDTRRLRPAARKLLRLRNAL